MDASSFFSNACINRGILNLGKLIERTKVKYGVNGICIEPGKACKGKLIKLTSEPKSLYTLSFDEIHNGFKLAASEQYFLVGECTFKRLHGWPMGGSHSEPGTQIDVGDFVHNLYTNPLSDHFGLN